MSNLNIDFEISDNEEDIDTHKKALSRSRSREKSYNDKGIQKVNHHFRGIYRKYTIEFKLKILTISEKYSLKYIEREYGVEPSLERIWKNKKNGFYLQNIKVLALKLLKQKVFSIYKNMMEK